MYSLAHTRQYFSTIPPRRVKHVYSATTVWTIFGLLPYIFMVFNIVDSYHNLNFISRKLAINEKVKINFLFTNLISQLS